MSNNLDLSHIPGPPVPRFIGHTLQVVRDAYGTQKQFMQDYGNVYKVKVLGEWRVNICGPDALAKVLLDKDRIFSSSGGWDLISRMFSGGLMLQDFDHHRLNRRIMQSAFRAEALQNYMDNLGITLKTLIDEWPRDKPFDFSAAIKTFTLQTGCAVFMGVSADSALAQKLNKAFKAEIKATMTPLRVAFPFTPMWRGERGRAFLRRTFAELIPERRANPGDDFFSQMCIAKDENGATWSDEEIVDHFNFLMLAAHDTLATTLTAIVWALGAHTEWQDTLAAEIAALGDGPLKWSDLKDMVQTEHVFKEAVRLVAPVPFIPRRTLKAFDWNGYHIPAGTEISLNPGVTMLSDDFFTNPDQFDPGRFSANRAEDQAHKFAWAPFGGGAHKCIGMHFAMMQVKMFLITLLRSDRIELRDTRVPNWQRMPIPKPRGGLTVTLRPLRSKEQG